MRLAGIIVMSMICGANVMGALMLRAGGVYSWKRHIVGAIASAAMVGLLSTEG